MEPVKTEAPTPTGLKIDGREVYTGDVIEWEEECDSAAESGGTFWIEQSGEVCFTDYGFMVGVHRMHWFATMLDHGWGVRNVKIAQSAPRPNSTDANWISVEDRLPEDDSHVLVWHTDGEYTKPIIAWFIHGEFDASPFMSIEGVTHWMPLPKPPTE